MFVAIWTTKKNGYRLSDSLKHAHSGVINISKLILNAVDGDDQKNMPC